ncbi:MAG: twitching motility protein PilT [Lachnospiraceae bacterium]|nr:twitching motility protein PilT [Lachnospiraceae bacterium]MBR0152898.1 twitching motility protein PilT [Lachnospiraceae bacterium]
MIQIICGEKGKGKTKILLDHVSKAVKEANGSLVYLDKSNQHMFELSNRVRLINCTEYMISNSSEFVGFISGIISQDHDLETIYLDSFLKVAKTTKDNLEAVLRKLNDLSEAFHVTIIMSVSMDREELPEFVSDKILAAL